MRPTLSVLSDDLIRDILNRPDVELGLISLNATKSDHLPAAHSVGRSLLISEPAHSVIFSNRCSSVQSLQSTGSARLNARRAGAC